MAPRLPRSIRLVIIIYAADIFAHTRRPRPCRSIIPGFENAFDDDSAGRRAPRLSLAPFRHSIAIISRRPATIARDDAKPQPRPAIENSSCRSFYFRCFTVTSLRLIRAALLSAAFRPHDLFAIFAIDYKRPGLLIPPAATCHSAGLRAGQIMTREAAFHTRSFAQMHT